MSRGGRLRLKGLGHPSLSWLLLGSRSDSPRGPCIEVTWGTFKHPPLPNTPTGLETQPASDSSLWHRVKEHGAGSGPEGEGTCGQPTEASTLLHRSRRHPGACPGRPRPTTHKGTHSDRTGGTPRRANQRGASFDCVSRLESIAKPCLKHLLSTQPRAASSGHSGVQQEGGGDHDGELTLPWGTNSSRQRVSGELQTTRSAGSK